MSINALSKGLELLQCFSATTPAWGVTELSARLGLHKSRVHRILQTLVTSGFIVQDQTTLRYHLGWNLFQLAQAADPDYPLRIAARPHLFWLREQTRGSVYLRVLRGGGNVIIETVESSHPLRLVQPPGTIRPAHYGASGKVLLAFSPKAVRESLLNGSHLIRFTPRSIVDRDAFLAELERVRRRGFAFTNEEAVVGVRSVAAPILSPDAVAIAAVTSALPAQTLPLRLIRVHARAVVQCGAKIARSLFGASKVAGSASGRREE
jgi:DNA-binding IclR family transcriptional regulator